MNTSQIPQVVLSIKTSNLSFHYHPQVIFHRSQALVEANWSFGSLPSQKKTFPVFLEENSTPRKSRKKFRAGWFREIGDLAWVCSTSNDWHSMQNNALCCHPLGDQHPDHVIEVIAHHPIQPSDHQPWCDQNRSHIISNHVTSCHIVSRDIMTCHLISFYFIQPWQVAPPASVIKCLVGCTGCPFIPRFLKSEPRISSTTSRQPGCSVSACSG